MKIAVFGSGAYYQKYKHYLCKCDIQYIIDNDKEKQGKEIDGITVYAPDEVDYNQCVYIIILIRESVEVRAQLLKLGIAENKIISYFDIGEKILCVPLTIKSQKSNITIEKWFEKSKTPHIMLVSHELSRTGVPVALMNLAILLKKMKYSVLLVAIKGGNLHNELEDNDIAYISEFELYFKNASFWKNAGKMDLFILGTVGLHYIIPEFAGLGKPVIWWMHESDPRGYETYKRPVNYFKNIFYYTGGKRVDNALRKYWGITTAKELLYYLPEKECKDKRRNKEVIFAIIGSFVKRKAQDILVSALERIPAVYDDKYKVMFVGNVSSNMETYYNDLKIIEEKHSNIEFIGEMSQTELEDLYGLIDVLICPSRDDPMPIVVTQAMQHGITCIVSDQVGQKEFIQSGKNGYVFENENSEELACIIKNVIDNPIEWKKMGEKSRIIYEEKFSEQRMRLQLMEIFNQVLL